jgi:hypothetical protein
VGIDLVAHGQIVMNNSGEWIGWCRESWRGLGSAYDSRDKLAPGLRQLLGRHPALPDGVKQALRAHRNDVGWGSHRFV